MERKRYNWSVTLADRSRGSQHKVTFSTYWSPKYCTPMEIASLAAIETRQATKNDNLVPVEAELIGEDKEVMV